MTNEKEIDTRRSASELAKHLAHHGMEVTVDTVDAAGRDVGTVIKSYCATRDADLLVMGAYGHSRLREFILGGATNSMLSRADPADADVALAQNLRSALAISSSSAKEAAAEFRRRTEQPRITIPTSWSPWSDLIGHIASIISN